MSRKPAPTPEQNPKNPPSFIQKPRRVSQNPKEGRFSSIFCGHPKLSRKPAPTPEKFCRGGFTLLSLDLNSKIPKTRPLLFKNHAGYPKTPKRAGLVQFSVGILNCLENLPLHRKNSVGAGLPCYLSISTPRSQKPALFYSKTTPGIPKSQRGQVWFNFLWVSEIVW